MQGVELHHNVTAGVILSDQSLVLQSVTKSLAGDYTCLAANTEGRGTSNPVTLRVRCESSLNNNFSYFISDFLVYSRSSLCQWTRRIAGRAETWNAAIKMWSWIFSASRSLSLDIQFIRWTNGAHITITNNRIRLVPIKLHSNIGFGLWNDIMLGEECHRHTKNSMRVSNCCGRWAF